MKKTLYVLLLSFSFIGKLGAQPGIIHTIAGNGISAYLGDGSPATSAEFSYVPGICRDVLGNIYIADNNNHRIRKVNAATGIVTTIAGTGIPGFSGDGGPATNAQMHYAGEISIDSAGDLFFVDALNNRIRKIDAATGFIITVAGDGSSTSCADGAPATSGGVFPFSVFSDITGNIYLTDGSRIRKVDAVSGIISTVAGNGGSGFSGDGGAATSASLHGPTDMYVDSAQNIYIADGGNNRVRKVTAATGIISTIAGTGTVGYSGDGGPATAAELNVPLAVTLDRAHNVYISEGNNNVVRRISSTSDTIYTIVGHGAAGYSGDGGPAYLAKLSYPHYTCVDSSGNLYIADDANSCVRKVDGPVPVPPITLHTGQNKMDRHILIYPNPTNCELNICAEDEFKYVEIINSLGETMLTQEVNARNVRIFVNDLPLGFYFVRINSNETMPFLKN